MAIDKAKLALIGDTIARQFPGCVFALLLSSDTADNTRDPDHAYISNMSELEAMVLMTAWIEHRVHDATPMDVSMTPRVIPPTGNN